MEKTMYVSGWTDGKISEILTDPYYAKALENLKEKNERFIATEPPTVTFSLLHLFELTGDRATFENVYKEYTQRLNTLTISYMLFKDERCITPLANLIWQICNFESWGIAAHVREHEPLDKRRRWLELYSTEMGRNIAFTLAVAGDALPTLVSKRAEWEIRERIIGGYEKYDFWWMKTTNNWAAVCAAGVLASYLFVGTKEEIECAIPRLLTVAEHYLSGFDKDGVCKEGYNYWTFGFTSFCQFADMLNNYTEGRINLFLDERVHKIAKFQENCAINDHECIRFSDCGEIFAPSAPISHFLKDHFPDVQIPTIPAPTEVSDLYSLIWINPAYNEGKMQPKSVIFTDAQWFIYRSEKYNFVCKAGSNAESHNHNDIGSFMISKGGRVTFTDPGSGAYTARYFSDSRYEILEPSARAHSVPIINGNLQVRRTEKSTLYKAEPREFSFSMQNGYEIPTLNSLKRSFVCQDDVIVLTDEYSFSKAPESVVERFVTLREPAFAPGSVTVGDSTLVYDENLFELVPSTETCVRKADVNETLYIIDLKAKELKEKMTLSVKFI